MNNFEAYIHTNGSLMVKKVPAWCDNIVDQNSPYVAKYLGKKMLPSLNQAKQYFYKLNGGRKYVDLPKKKRGDL